MIHLGVASEVASNLARDASRLLPNPDGIAFTMTDRQLVMTDTLVSISQLRVSRIKTRNVRRCLPLHLKRANPYGSVRECASRRFHVRCYRDIFGSREGVAR